MKPGDKVMCVDVNWVPPLVNTAYPMLGDVCTVRKVLIVRKSILIEGIVSPCPGRSGVEYAFYQWHFRKLDDIPDKVPTLAAEVGAG